MSLTGLVPGSIPPFGQPILDLPLYLDSSLTEDHPDVAFNARDLCVSVVLATTECLRTAAPFVAASFT